MEATLLCDFVRSVLLLGNGMVNTFPQQRIHTAVEEQVDKVFSMHTIYLKIFVLSNYIY
jgi:hypothetical protein